MREWIEICISELLFAVSLVSLFMREWIEIPRLIIRWNIDFVSLFMREWIEILIVDGAADGFPSPSS